MSEAERLRDLIDRITVRVRLRAPYESEIAAWRDEAGLDVSKGRLRYHHYGYGDQVHICTRCGIERRHRTTHTEWRIGDGPWRRGLRSCPGTLHDVAGKVMR